MCDFSLHNVKSRPAKVGDRLTNPRLSHRAPGDCASEDASMAVCLLPGTELSFAGEVTCCAQLSVRLARQSDLS